MCALVPGVLMQLAALQMSETLFDYMPHRIATVTMGNKLILQSERVKLQLLFKA